MTTALFAVGVLAIVAGTAVLLWPAALIVAGTILAGIAWRLEEVDR